MILIMCDFQSSPKISIADAAYTQFLIEKKDTKYKTMVSRMSEVNIKNRK